MVKHLRSNQCFKLNESRMSEVLFIFALKFLMNMDYA